MAQQLKQIWKKQMPVKLLWVSIFPLALLITGCSKKHQPQRETSIENETSLPPKVTAPRVISVNDKAAKKSVDGRLYYDIDRRRYWKNYNDGKYYLFNKAMYNDPAFKPH
jgi:hypothetical protein